jgi:hypothetical protein
MGQVSRVAVWQHRREQDARVEKRTVGASVLPGFARSMAFEF